MGEQPANIINPVIKKTSKEFVQQDNFHFPSKILFLILTQKNITCCIKQEIYISQFPKDFLRFYINNMDAWPTGRWYNTGTIFI